MSQIAFYAGWYDGNVSGPFTRPKVEFMPGAFAYHLHSYSAAHLRSTSQTWVGPLLAKGATITMGCVAEPYLGGTPDIAIFASRFIFNGFSFGEAAYASQPILSWQTTIVGDPLYRPFGKPAQQLHEALVEKKSDLLEWSFLRLINMNIARGLSSIQMAAFAENILLTKQSSVLTEKLADLYSAQGKPSSAIEMYERALDLKPSPEQKIRLRLALGERLIAANRNEDAAENYGRLLQENSDYPARAAILHKLQTIALKLGKQEAADNYEKQIRELTPAAK
jgi:tetratricopeptide (TPR) repeat protein